MSSTYTHTPYTALLAEWKEGMTALASAPNVVCKVGALCNYDAVLGYGDWTHEAVSLYTKHCLSTFGVERCLYESNVPTDLLVGDFSQRTTAMLNVAREVLTEQELGLFLRDNATRVYRLPV